MYAIHFRKENMGHRAYFFIKPIFLSVSEKNEYICWELFLASTSNNWFVNYILKQYELLMPFYTIYTTFHLLTIW